MRFLKFGEKNYIDENDIALKLCKQYIEENDLSKIQCGKYLINGEDFFVNIVCYETKKKEECIWEAHRKFIDVHYLIEGREKIRVADIKNMNIEQYFSDTDYVKICDKGGTSIDIDLEKGDMLEACFEDAHMTGVCIEKPEMIKKAIFKVNKRLVE